jgi:hypothetical protein
MRGAPAAAAPAAPLPPAGPAAAAAAAASTRVSSRSASARASSSPRRATAVSAAADAAASCSSEKRWLTRNDAATYFLVTCVMHLRSAAVTTLVVKLDTHASNADCVSASSVLHGAAVMEEEMRGEWASGVGQLC